MITFGGGYEIINRYLILALTQIHAGSGSKIYGFVDLPIQRDSYDFPIIWGSSIKGAMRGCFKIRGNDSEIENIIFGPREESAADYASSIVVTDANLLLIPIRSLYGIYAYATNTFLLNKAKILFSLVNDNKAESIDRIVSLCKEKIANWDSIISSEEIIKDNKAVLMEQEINCMVEDRIKQEFENILPNNLPIPKDEISKRIVILSDRYSSLIKRATIISTRIAIDYEKKTVKGEALWSEEYLPELTIMYNLILARKPRVNTQKIGSAKEVIEKLTQGLGGNLDQFTLVLGGHETIGKGIVEFCRVE